VANIHQALKKYYGYDDFRPGQEAIINSILAGQDTVAFRPTGSGKSICFQIPALCLPGLTLVISPLISLMADQVQALQAKNIAATFLNSSLGQEEFTKRLGAIRQGQYKLIYVAPERLLNQKFFKAVQNCQISLIAVDEAHCVSMWGHDFRPHYQDINLFVQRLPKRPVIAAFTATATNLIKQDILQLLDLQQAHIFEQSRLRNNLQLNVIGCSNRGYKQIALIKLLKSHADQCGIVYTATRKQAVSLSQLINQLNFKHQLTQGVAQAYHGGMTSQERARVQDKFMHGKTNLICATNAFGMGVDKDNIRFVIHDQLPANLENYYQEVGRAGRDGKPSFCYLLFSEADIAIQKGLLLKGEAQQNTKNQKRLLKHKLKKLEKMIEFAQNQTCLNQLIADYFDLPLEKRGCDCGFCQQFQIKLSEQETDYWRSCFQNQIFQQLPQQLQYYLTILQPKNKQHLQRIPGIGKGLLKCFQEQAFIL
jgi:ATP-dependent DNA helicase RecQ